MATTHEKELERARRKRQQAAEEERRSRRTMVALVAVLVVGALGLGAVLVTRGGDDADLAGSVTQSDDAVDQTSDAADTDTDDGQDAQAASMSAPQGADAEPCPAATGDVPSPSLQPYDEQPTVDLGDVETVTATLETTCGTIVLELDAAAAPATVGNFVALAEDGYYEGVGFHRVINGFMIQGGDPTGTGSGCADDDCSTRLPGYQFADELAAAEAVVEAEGGYPRGAVAMANAGPDTNGSQFFIVQADPGYALPPAYAVFGEVASGMDVVDRIAQGPVAGDLAVDPVVITAVTIER